MNGYSHFLCAESSSRFFSSSAFFSWYLSRIVLTRLDLSILTNCLLLPFLKVEHYSLLSELTFTLTLTTFFFHFTQMSPRQLEDMWVRETISHEFVYSSM